MSVININKKWYTRKRPSHPDDCHSPPAKRWFKRKGRKRVRKKLKSVTLAAVSQNCRFSYLRKLSLSSFDETVTNIILLTPAI